MKRLIKAMTVTLLITASFMITAANAHSGRTDSRGGHKDNKNASGLGNYHYHCGGYPAHLHTNGVCPYKGGTSESAQTNATTSSQNIDKVTLSNVPTQMKMGENRSIDYKITSSKSNPAVSFKSSDENVVSVGNNGQIYAKSPRTANITVSTEDDSQTFTLEISEIPVGKVELSDENTDIQLGKSTNIKATLYPDNASYKNINWTSENDDIATVDENGNISAHSVGETKIYATSHNSISSYVMVKVYEVVPEQIEITSENIDLDINETYTIVANVIPDNSNNKNLTYKTDNDVIEVDENGIIQPLKEGSSTVTITTSNGISDTISVTIYNKKKRQAMAATTGFVGLGGIGAGVVYIYRRKKI